MPAAGNWAGLYFSSAPAGSLLENVVLEHAATGINLYNSSPTLRCVSIDQTSGDAIFANGSQPIIDRVNLDGIAGYGLSNSSSVITAPYIWWGDPSGPQNSGNVGATGFPVSDGVAFAPFALAPNECATHTSLLNETVITTNQNPPQRLSYGFDALASTTVLTTSGSANFTLNFGYDGAHRLSTVAPATGQDGVASTYTRDALGRIVGQSNRRMPDGTVLTTSQQSYDLPGNVVTISDTVQSQTFHFQYDALNRLTDAQVSAGQTEHYTYDAAGNRTGRTTGGTTTAYTYNAGNELVAAGVGVTYTYDANGNLRTSTRSGQITTYTWDSRGRLVRIDYPNNTYSTYGYDAGNRRVSKRDPAGATTYYVYDGLNLVQELDVSGALLASYVHSAALDHPYSMTRDGQTYYYVYDTLGSVVGLTDGSGAFVARYAYDPWGNLSSSTGTLSNPFRWVGREYDSESGLYFMRARYYDPQVGRFISRDPIGTIAGLNMYTYLHNRPLNGRDVLGLDDEDIGPFSAEGQSTGFQLGAAFGDFKLSLNGDWKDVTAAQLSGNYSDPLQISSLQSELKLSGTDFKFCSALNRDDNGNFNVLQVGLGYEHNGLELDLQGGPNGGFQGEIEYTNGSGVHFGVQVGGDTGGGYNVGLGIFGHF